MFQRKHSHHLARYIELTTFAKRKRGDSLGGASRPSKQPKINAGATVTSCQASQAKVDRLILGYLTEGLLPLSTVELPGIKDLIVGLQPNHTMLCRATVKMRFDEMVCVMKGNTRDTLHPLSFVVTTTDSWTAHRRSYIGVTVDVRTQVGSACLSKTGRFPHLRPAGRCPGRCQYRVWHQPEDGCLERVNKLHTVLHTSRNVWPLRQHPNQAESEAGQIPVTESTASN